MAFLEYYWKVVSEQEEINGLRTIVLIEKGKFYEAYQYDSHLELKDSFNNKDISIEEYTRKIEDERTLYGSGYFLKDNFGLSLGPANKNKPHNPKNPLMAGIPSTAYDKWEKKFLQKKFTVVCIDQVERLANNTFRREISKITSPATNIGSQDDGFFDDNNYLLENKGVVSIYIECQKPNKKVGDYQLVCGYSYINSQTGYNIVSESYSVKKNVKEALQDVYRFLLAHPVNEIIINVEDVPDPEKYRIFIEKELHLCTYPIKIVNIGKLPKNFTQRNFQEEFFHKVFDNPKIDENQIIDILDERVVVPHIRKNSIIEDLDLERLPYGIISYICLLQYFHQRNPKIIELLEHPTIKWSDEEENLILTHNALQQLDILPDKNFNTENEDTGYTCLLDVLLNEKSSRNRSCKTKMGARKMKKRIFNPITDAKILNNSYNLIEEFMFHKELLAEIRQKLSIIDDIENLGRLTKLQLIKPNQLVKLLKSYDTISTIVSLLVQHSYEKDNTGKMVIKTNDNNSQALNSQAFNLGAFNSSSNIRIFNSGKVAISKILPYKHQDFSQKFNNLLKYIHQTFDYDLLKKADCRIQKNLITTFSSTQNFFVKNFFSAADECQKIIENCENLIKNIVTYLNQFITGRSKGIEFTMSKDLKSSDGVKIEIYTSATSGKKLENNPHIDTNICGVLHFRKLSSRYHISSPMIDSIINDYITASKNFNQYLLNG